LQKSKKKFTVNKFLKFINCELMLTAEANLVRFTAGALPPYASSGKYQAASPAQHVDKAQ